MSSTTRNATFYSIWPVLGKRLNWQWGNIRQNTAESNAAIESTVLDVQDGEDILNARKAVQGREIGEMDFQRRWRTYYDPDEDKWKLQRNSNTQADPIWVDTLELEDVDGDLTHTGDSATFTGIIYANGGIFTDAGFYGFGRTQLFSNQSGIEWQVNHNFNNTPVMSEVYTDNYKVITPSVISTDVSDPNTAYFYFASATTGRVLLSTGVVGGLTVTPAVRVTDGDNVYTTDTINFNQDHFYLSGDDDGKPVVNIEGLPDGTVLRTEGDNEWIGKSDSTGVIDNITLEGSGGANTRFKKVLGDTEEVTILPIAAGGTVLKRWENAGAVSFNYDNKDIDILVEGTGDPNLFRTDAGQDHVGIGISSPEAKLHVDGDIKAEDQVHGSGFYFNNGGNISVEEVSGTVNALQSTVDATSTVQFVDNANTDGGDYSITKQIVPATGTVSLTFSDDGSYVINETGRDVNVRIEGDNDNALLFTDAGQDHVGIGTATPEAKLHVDGDIRAEDKIVADGFYLNEGGELLTGVTFKESEFEGTVYSSDTLVVDSDWFYLVDSGDEAKPLLGITGIPNGVSLKTDPFGTWESVAGPKSVFQTIRRVSTATNTAKFIDEYPTSSGSRGIEKWITTYPSVTYKYNDIDLAVYNSSLGDTDFQWWGTAPGSDYLALHVDAAKRAVGIATDTPEAKLHVNGDIKAEDQVHGTGFYFLQSGNIYADGNSIIRSGASTGSGTSSFKDVAGASSIDKWVIPSVPSIAYRYENVNIALHNGTTSNTDFQWWGEVDPISGEFIALHIDAARRAVCIGTPPESAPGVASDLESKLYVNGDIRAEDKIVADGFYLNEGGDLVADATNEGGGTGEIFIQKVDDDLQFKTITGSGGAVITNNATTIDINAAGGGGGGGGFYGVIFKESEAGGAVYRDDTLVVDSDWFYLVDSGDEAKPLLGITGIPSGVSLKADSGTWESVAGPTSVVQTIKRVSTATNTAKFIDEYPTSSGSRGIEKWITTYPSVTYKYNDIDLAVYNSGLDDTDFQWWGVASGPDYIALHVDAAKRAVGIATDTPEAKLHVNGDIRAEDKIVADGFYLNEGGEVGTNGLLNLNKLNAGGLGADERIGMAVTAPAGSIVFTITNTRAGKAAGDDLKVQFDDINYDYTPSSIDPLTPGTDTAPDERFIYLIESGGTVTLTEGAAWPSNTPHVRIATVVVQSVAGVAANGALKIHAWTDHVVEPPGVGDGTRGSRGHLHALAERLRQEPAVWESGMAPTVGASNTLYISSTAGSGYQLHSHTIPAFDSDPGGGNDPIFVVNEDTSPYKTISRLDTGLTEYSDGSPIGVGDSFTVVFWTVVSENASDSKLFVNVPSGGYNNAAQAQADPDGKNVYTIPQFYHGTALLLLALTIQRSGGGGTWTSIQEIDLRGIPGVTLGGSGGQPSGVSDHGALSGLADDDHPQYGELTDTETVSGYWTFTNINGIRHQAASPFIDLEATQGAHTDWWIFCGADTGGDDLVITPNTVTSTVGFGNELQVSAPIEVFPSGTITLTGGNRSSVKSNGIYDFDTTATTFACYEASPNLTINTGANNSTFAGVYAAPTVTFTDNANSTCSFFSYIGTVVNQNFTHPSWNTYLDYGDTKTTGTIDDTGILDGHYSYAASHRFWATATGNWLYDTGRSFWSHARFRSDVGGSLYFATWNDFQVDVRADSVSGPSTVGERNCLSLPDESASGLHATQVLKFNGIKSEMIPGTGRKFINHTGGAESFHEGDFYLSGKLTVNGPVTNTEIELNGNTKDLTIDWDESSSFFLPIRRPMTIHTPSNLPTSSTETQIVQLATRNDGFYNFAWSSKYIFPGGGQQGPTQGVGKVDLFSMMYVPALDRIMVTKAADFFY